VVSVERAAWRVLAPLYRLPARRERVPIGYLIVGTKRGGSTSLAEWVTRHPSVAPCKTGKGTHYFDTNHQRGQWWFYSRFQPGSDRWKITGESSPYYMYHPAAPRRIAATLPDVKLIVVLRDPVERAWSQYKYEVARGYETETFATALDLEASRLEGERERLLSDPSYEGFAFRHHGYLERGHYADQLQLMYGLFPREQILVLQSEQMFADPDGTLDQVWAFLGLEPFVVQRPEARNAGRSHERVDPTNEARLVEYYRPFNERLYEQPGIDFRWARWATL
jgi:Sulfotransferase domain